MMCLTLSIQVLNSEVKITMVSKHTFRKNVSFIVADLVNVYSQSFKCCRINPTQSSYMWTVREFLVPLTLFEKQFYILNGGCQISYEQGISCIWKWTLCKISVKSPERIKKKQKNKQKSHHVLTVKVGDYQKVRDITCIGVVYLYK